MLTSGVDVEVGGLVSHVSCRLQTRSSGVHLAGVAHSLRYIHCIWTLVNVLTSEQHFDLRGGKTNIRHIQLVIYPVCVIFIQCSAKKVWAHLMDTLNFGQIGDGVGSVFVFVGFDLSLDNKKVGSNIRCCAV